MLSLCLLAKKHVKTLIFERKERNMREKEREQRKRDEQRRERTEKER